MSAHEPLALARYLFERAPFMQQLGVEVVEASAEAVVATLTLQPWMTQATGVAHAGIVTGLADHAAACAARLASSGDETFVSIEVHTTLVRPAAGPTLRIVGKPVRIGKRISFASAEVFTHDGQQERLCATFSVSLISAPERTKS